MSDESIPQLTGLFADAFRMSGLEADESILVLRQAQSRENYVSAVLNAVEAMGGHAEVLEIPGLKLAMFPFGGSPDHVVDIDSYVESKPYILELVKRADLLVDLAAEGLIHTDIRAAAMSNDVRVYSIREPPEVLERNAPRESLKTRMQTAKERFRDADTMQIRSGAGTDLTVSIGDDPTVFAPDGIAEEPGEWDLFTGGFLACYPIDDSPSGRIVVDTGDVLHPMNQYVDRPIDIRIEDGVLTDIEGDGFATRLMNWYLGMWDDEDAYETSHFGIGLNERAIWEGLAFGTEEHIGHENRGYLGGFLWSTGPNRSAGRDTRAHLDISMRACTVALDGDVIVDAGEVVAPSLQP